VKLESVMKTLHEELTTWVGRKGWERKGNGGVTQSMVNTNISQYSFVKEYNGEKVTMTIKVNFREDYGNTGYNELLIKGGNTMMGQDGWWPRKEGSNVKFDGVLTDRFYLEKLLNDLDRVNS